MNRAELWKFTATLNAKDNELQQRLGKREGIAIERTPDTLDEVQLAADRAFATGRLEQDTRLLNDVRTALTRVDDGTYGVCLQCEEEISSKRLQAIPWEQYCIACQERADRNLPKRIANEDRFLMDAA